MKIEEKNLLPLAKTRLESLLSVIPFVQISAMETEVMMGRGRADLVLDVLASGQPMKLVIEVKRQAEPRLMRMAAMELKDLLSNADNSVGIIAAPYLSPAAIQICREAGLGCMDLSGNAFFSFGNVYIEKSGQPNAFLDRRPLRSLFSPKTSRVLRVLLADPSKPWRVEALSKAARISLGLAFKAKQALIFQEWVKEEGKTIRLTKPKEMLEAWSASYDHQKSQLYSFFSRLSERALEEAVKTECDNRGYRYGLAFFSGARRVAPFVRFPKTFVYVDGPSREIAITLGLQQVGSGANVALLEPHDAGIFLGSREIDGLNVVSDIQLYLDLKSYGGRGEEAARAVFEQRIEPQW